MICIERSEVMLKGVVVYYLEERTLNQINELISKKTD